MAQKLNGIREKSVLLPTDFSKNADAALKYAIGLVKDFNSRLIILHSYRLVQTTVSSVDQSPFSLKNQWDKDTWEKFRNLEESLIKKAKINYAFEVDVGFASDAIVSSVEANSIDFVVMGAAGIGAMSQMLGSTTLKILDKIKCPVMVVPPDAEYTGLHKIIFAYDNKKIKQLTKLNMLLDYVKNFQAKLEIINISADKSIIDNNIKILDEHFKETDHQFTSIQSESIAEGILNYLREKPADLLVALKRDHTFWEKIFGHSVTKKLVLNSELPILVLHES